MSQPLSEQTIALVKATVPALEAHGLEIVRVMYARMFENPMIRDLFNQSHHGETGSQPKALATAILAYGRNIDNLGALAPAVERIAQKHVGLQILPEHYSYVAEALLGAIKEVLGEAATPQILGAWGEAYWFLANILIAREDHIYHDLASAEGGWSGWRTFVVDEVRPESAIITSFVLRPTDGRPVIAHKPGQYLTFWLEIPGHPPLKRNYSISAAPNGTTYRISVKREPQGIASNWLHDHAAPGTVLKVAPPAGEFFLADRPERPVVLLSGGVGLTPMVAMLETIAQRHPDLPVHYAHGTLNGSTHAMGDHVRSLVADRPNIRITTFHQQPRTEDVAERDFDEAGLIDEEWLRQETMGAEADYYLCGPRPFLRTFVSTLSLAGVPSDRIHYEFFGPADELLAA
ncbi:NO-inducible flavohemoprotein [Arthrobacter sp. TPD3018]|uniref:NO-inducible flavohemoprotein n=1 Tax=Bacteria TaxID=2 RepID=UPI000D513907|nr:MULTISPECIES: NO-inducible flavohemoprotein [Bacteria]PVE51289.1 NO-inducible flavohemoprotein [Sphingomonas sp. TPD3009]PVE51579.1 NO-inducible flavohemoprotein [Arthrobacter sp. TPD3018]PVE80232.1 NO-inducible flavohemoprotein [Sphingomonas melonis]